MELPLDRFQIVEDVRMIELEIIQNRGPGTVMDELRALVEERSVVLIRFYYEKRGVGMARGDGKVHRYAADEKSRLASGALENPGDHRRNGGLTVRTRDGEDVAAGQHMLGKPLRPRDIALAAVEDRFHERIAPRDDIAYDPEVGPQADLFLGESF